MTAANHYAGPNAREAEYWNSAASRPWAEQHQRRLVEFRMER